MKRPCRLRSPLKSAFTYATTLQTRLHAAFLITCVVQAKLVHNSQAVNLGPSEYKLVINRSELPRPKLKRSLNRKSQRK